jgi:plastocyanin
MARLFQPALLLAALALSLSACGGGSSNEAAGSTTETSGEGGAVTIAGSQANDHGKMDVSGKDEVSLELDDFYFDPTILQGTPGQALKIELENEGGTEHNFSIDDQGLDQDVEAGEDTSVMVTFPDSGELQFYCKYHKQQGMVGGLQAGS